MFARSDEFESPCEVRSLQGAPKGRARFVKLCIAGGHVLRRIVGPLGQIKVAHSGRCGCYTTGGRGDKLSRPRERSKSGRAKWLTKFNSGRRPTGLKLGPVVRWRSSCFGNLMTTLRPAGSLTCFQKQVSRMRDASGGSVG